MMYIPKELFTFYLQNLPNYSYNAKQLFNHIINTNVDIMHDDTIEQDCKMMFSNVKNIHKININKAIYLLLVTRMFYNKLTFIFSLYKTFNVLKNKIKTP